MRTRAHGPISPSGVGTASTAPEPAAAPLNAPGVLISAGDSIDYTSMPSAYQPTDPKQITSPIDLVVKRVGSERGYQLKQLNISNPGESSASALDKSKPSNGSWAKDASGNLVPTHPLHVPYQSSQIDELVKLLKENPSTRGVVYSVGANDLLLMQDAAEKSKNTTVYEVEHLPGLLYQLGKNLRAAIKQMRTIYDGPILLQAPYSPDYRSKISDASLLATLGVYRAVASEENRRGKPVVVVDGYHALEKAAAKTPGGEPALLWKNPDGTANLHTNLAGQAVLADAIYDGLERYV